MGIKIPIKELVKNHHGGCVLYSIAIMLNKDLDEILERTGLPKNYWVSERDLYELEKRFPIEVLEIYQNAEKVVDSKIENYNTVVVLYDDHSVVVYGMDEKYYFIYDSYKGRKKKIKKERLGSLAEYVIIPK